MVILTQFIGGLRFLSVSSFFFFFSLYLKGNAQSPLLGQRGLGRKDGAQVRNLERNQSAINTGFVILFNFWRSYCCAIPVMIAVATAPAAQCFPDTKLP